MEWSINMSNISVVTFPSEISDYQIAQEFCTDINSQVFIGILFLTSLLIIKILLSYKLFSKIKKYISSIYEFSSIILLFYLSGIAVTKLDLVSEIFLKRFYYVVIMLVVITSFYVIWILTKKERKIKEKNNISNQ